MYKRQAPTFEKTLDVRDGRQHKVTDFLAGATPELLPEERNNPWGGEDWHPTVGDCVRVILEEHWAPCATSDETSHSSPDE